VTCEANPRKSSVTCGVVALAALVACGTGQHSAAQPAVAERAPRDSAVAGAVAVATQRMAVHGKSGLSVEDLKRTRDWFTPEIFALLVRDMSDPGGIGYLNWDPFTAAQDESTQAPAATEGRIRRVRARGRSYTILNNAVRQPVARPLVERSRMSRHLIVGFLFVAAGATRTLGAQAPTRGVAPGVALDPQVSQALRAGYGQRRTLSGILQRLAPDRPIVRQVPVVPEAIAPLAQGPSTSRCPMPVAKADPRALATMPVARADSTRLERMPVARSTCVNPLDSR